MRHDSGINAREVARCYDETFLRGRGHATGIDTITSVAGVAKKSLYNNFSSKAEIVSAYIDSRHEEWLDL